MLIIGIDPGLSGSICFFEDGKILDVIEMPTMAEGKKNKRQVNGAQVYNEISKRINFSFMSNSLSDTIPSPFVSNFSYFEFSSNCFVINISLLYQGLY